MGEAGTQIAQCTHSKDQQQRKQPAVQTSKHVLHQPRSLSAVSRRVASASASKINSTNHDTSAVDTSPRKSGCRCELIASQLIAPPLTPAICAPRFTLHSASAMT